MKLFTSGNDKVGGALVFNLPVFKTCPGSTLFCRTYCYGDWFNNRWPSARQRHAANYQATLRPDFVDRIVAELQDSARRRSKAALLVRVHSVGDFYDAEYVRKWLDIAIAAPAWSFWAYTRSWRVPNVLPELGHLALLPNFFLWLSADRHTGMPPQMHGARGVAWMQADGDNPDLGKNDLVFPIKHDSRQPVKRLGLAIVCPHYNGTPRDKAPTCQTCGICFATAAKDG